MLRALYILFNINRMFIGNGTLSNGRHYMTGILCYWNIILSQSKYGLLILSVAQYELFGKRSWTIKGTIRKLWFLIKRKKLFKSVRIAEEKRSFLNTFHWYFRNSSSLFYTIKIIYPVFWIPNLFVILNQI